ncbi:MAG: beta-lactamase family protein, partial [Anaerolineae bacterium]|nr:beta-lactamase family protein [Anaerolineae bacterium]
MVSPDVTIKHLLAHTSGIPDYYDEEEVDDFEDFFLDIPWYRLKHPTDYLPLFPDKPVKFPPGEGFSYCNGGFILLGAIVEAVTGKPFQAFVQERVFDALGMEESGFFPMNALPERTAFGYVKKPEGWITNIYHLPIIGASDGGAFTTAADMQRFWRGLWAENVLSPDLRGLFWKPNRRAEDEGPDVYYGHGFWVKAPMARTPFPFLEGADAGVSFQSLFIPESDTVITLLSNTLEGIWPLAGIIHAHIAGNLPAHSQADTTTETT